MCTVGQCGLLRMQHERDAHRLETAPGQLRTRRARGRRQRVAGDVRETDAAALEELSAFENPRAAAAAQALAGAALPRVGGERVPSNAPSVSAICVCRP